jgi:hypothetical protein
MATPPTYSPPIVKSSKPIPIDTSGVLGGLPVAEQTQDYFITFQQAGGTGPEIIGETAYFITYLVQSDGTLSKPAEGGDALLNLEQNFPVGKNVNVRINQGTALNAKLGGEQTVTAIGKQQPILFTQTGFSSSSFITSSTNFKFKGDNTIPGITNPKLISDYRGVMKKDNQFPDTLEEGVIDFDTIITAPSSSAATFNTTNGTYTLIPNKELVSLYVEVIINLKYVDPEYASQANPSSSPSSLNAQFQLQLNNNNTWNEIVFGTIDLPKPPSSVYNGDNNNTPSEQLILSTILTGNSLSNLGTNPKVRLNSLTQNEKIRLTGIQFKISSQSPAPQTNFELPAQPLWSTGSGLVGAQWLTASNALSLNYGLTQDYNSMKPLLEANGFNISPIQTPFKLKTGDRIRFEYDKAKDFYIYDVIPPNCDDEGLLKIKINQYLPTNTVLNNFIIHRTDINDPLYIILNVDKDEIVGDTQNFSGLILPQYPTKELINNLDNILVDLKERGIIIDNEN